MTKNNLKTHLTWLVGSSTFAPPPPRPIPLSVESTLPLSSGSEDPLHEEPAPAAYFPPSRQTAGHDVGVGNPRPEFACPQLPANTPPTEDTETMARLQSGSKSNNKPKLLSQAPLGKLRTPTPNQIRPSSVSLRDQYSAPYERGLFKGLRG